MSASIPAAPDGVSARLGAVIAGAGGALLIVALFLPWYKLFGAGLVQGGGVGDVINDVGDAVGVDVRDEVSQTGWEAFEIADIFCLIAGVLALIRAVVAVLGPSENPQVPGSVLVGGFGAAALLMVIYRIANPPGVGSERELGVWLGLGAAAMIVYGSYLAYQARSDRPRL